MSQQANFSQQAPASFAPIHSHLDSIITRQMHGIAIKGISNCIQVPPPQPQQPPQGLTVGGADS